MSANDTLNAIADMEAAQRARAFLEAIDGIIARNGKQPNVKTSTEIHALVDRAIESGQADALVDAMATECAAAHATAAYLTIAMLHRGKIQQALRQTRRNPDIH